VTFDEIRRLEGDIRAGDDPLGACQPLLHCARVDQKGPGNLGDGQSGHDSQSKSRLILGAEVRMAANEEKP